MSELEGFMRARCQEKICGHIENIKYQLSAVWQMFIKTISSVGQYILLQPLKTSHQL